MLAFSIRFLYHFEYGLYLPQTKTIFINPFLHRKYEMRKRKRKKLSVVKSMEYNNIALKLIRLIEGLKCVSNGKVLDSAHDGNKSVDFSTHFEYIGKSRMN